MKMRFLSLMIAFGLVFSNGGLNVYADTISITDEGSAAVNINAEIPSTFSVTIPKRITLDSGTKEVTFEVSAEGDIAGDEALCVELDDSIALSSNGKEDVEASVSIDKDRWLYNEFSTPGNATITAEDLSAGSWDAVLNFNIYLEKIVAGYQGAGLYNANDVMLCSWEDSGINSKCSNIDDVILTKYPTTKSVVVSPDITSMEESCITGLDNLNIYVPATVTSFKYSPLSSCTNSVIYYEGSETSWENIEKLYGFYMESTTTIIYNTSPEDIMTMPAESTDYQGAGLYDADMRLLCSWEDSGIDMEISQSYPSGVNEATAEYVIANNYPDTSIVIIPEGVTKLGPYSFYSKGGNKLNISKVVMPEGVVEIGGGSFLGTTNLCSIVVPKSLSSIDGTAFTDCTSLTDIYYAGSEDEWSAISMSDETKNNISNATVHYNYVVDFTNLN